MKATQDRQKSYADQCRKPLEFEEGDKVFLKVYPIPVKAIWHFNAKGKLIPCFVGLYDIVQMINPVAYMLILPLELQHVQEVFHVSQLQKYVHDPTHAIVFEPSEIGANGLTYEERPVIIMDYRVKLLRKKNRTIG